jgi:hypothetical protein
MLVGRPKVLRGTTMLGISSGMSDNSPEFSNVLAEDWYGVRGVAFWATGSGVCMLCDQADETAMSQPATIALAFRHIEWDSP